ncbi:MAG: hypothetical protein RL637_1119 [Pseudomonadota bacterium]
MKNIRRLKKIQFALISIISLILMTSVKADYISEAIHSQQLFKTDQTWFHQPLVYPPGQAELTSLVVEIAPGGETGWHLHPIPSLELVLEGTVEVKLADGTVKQFHAGESFSEVLNTMHNGKNIGDKPMKLLIFYAGAKDQPLTIAHPEFIPTH